jgi:hypothetical protein
MKSFHCFIRRFFYIICFEWGSHKVWVHFDSLFRLYKFEPLLSLHKSPWLIFAVSSPFNPFSWLKLIFLFHCHFFLIFLLSVSWLVKSSMPLTNLNFPLQADWSFYFFSNLFVDFWSYLFWNQSSPKCIKMLAIPSKGFPIEINLQHCSMFEQFTVFLNWRLNAWISLFTQEYSTKTYLCGTSKIIMLVLLLSCNNLVICEDATYELFLYTLLASVLTTITSLFVRLIKFITNLSSMFFTAAPGFIKPITSNFALK